MRTEKIHFCEGEREELTILLRKIILVLSELKLSLDSHNSRVLQSDQGRKEIGKKLFDLGNLAIAGMVFAQFTLPTKDLRAIYTAFFISLICYVAGYLFTKY